MGTGSEEKKARNKVLKIQQPIWRIKIEREQPVT